MGGFGSGRWGWSKSDAKALVADCRCLDIGRLVQEGVVRAGRHAAGSWRWTRDGETVASVGYEVGAGADAGTLRLTVHGGPGRAREVRPGLRGPARDLEPRLRGAAVVAPLPGMPGRRAAVPPAVGETVPPPGGANLRVPPLP